MIAVVLSMSLASLCNLALPLEPKIGRGGVHRGACATRASTSRISATRPSPRMVAAAMPCDPVVVGFQALDDDLALALDAHRPAARCAAAASRSRPAGRPRCAAGDAARAIAELRRRRRSAARSCRGCAMHACRRRRARARRLGFGLQRLDDRRQRHDEASGCRPRRPCRRARRASAAGSCVKVEPSPGREVIEMRPPSAWIERLTTSMPTPRPEMSETVAAVEKPGRKIRLSISSSVSWASAGIRPLLDRRSAARAAG